MHPANTAGVQLLPHNAQVTRVRVKICGITRLADALAAVEAGADAIGFVFYPPSPRHVTVKQAQAIASRLPPFVTTVGLFVNADGVAIAEVVETVGVDLLQFHGDEPPDFCNAHRRPWLRALRMRPDIDLETEAEAFSAARGLLLDAYRPGVPGGTGETFDWSRIPMWLAARIVVAGGLEPGNVGDAVRRLRPYAVDVSGGVESAKGIKDPVKIREFMNEVRRAEQ
jgi:phosphoribosylanthranilate isomerase